MESMGSSRRSRRSPRGRRLDGCAIRRKCYWRLGRTSWARYSGLSCSARSHWEVVARRRGRELVPPPRTSLPVLGLVAILVRVVAVGLDDEHENNVTNGWVCSSIGIITLPSFVF
jgi:hypothetical protein